MTTAALIGVRAVPVEVEVSIANGLPSFAIVGLADKAVAESKERVRAALMAMGLPLPPKKIVVNLAPADLIKEGSHFDLPIALALLVAMQRLPQEEMTHYWAMGELSLDGSIQPVAGILPATMAAFEQGRGMICPAACGAEAAWTGSEQILAPISLLAVINHFKGLQQIAAPQPAQQQSAFHGPDMREIKGQATARRALEIAAAGAHNMMMMGPPGSGKSMLAACLPGILPPMAPAEILEVSMIASIAGTLEGGALSDRRPFRAPHHSSSMAAMVGGGKRALPGEISLAHRGVLFLDELPEFPRSVLESLRQPLETGHISVARAQAHVTYPANVQLIAAMNPCRCGYLADAGRACHKAPRCGMDYQGRISGPLLDRIDMHIEVPAVESWLMTDATQAESSAEVAARVAAARARQTERYQSQPHLHTNADLNGEWLQQFAMPEGKAKELLEQANQRFQFSMRGLTRIMRLARTIADLANQEEISSEAVAEAVAYRPVSLMQNSQVA